MQTICTLRKKAQQSSKLSHQPPSPSPLASIPSSMQPKPGIQACERDEKQLSHTAGIPAVIKYARISNFNDTNIEQGGKWSFTGTPRALRTLMIQGLAVRSRGTLVRNKFLFYQNRALADPTATLFYPFFHRNQAKLWSNDCIAQNYGAPYSLCSTQQGDEPDNSTVDWSRPTILTIKPKQSSPVLYHVIMYY